MANMIDANKIILLAACMVMGFAPAVLVSAENESAPEEEVLIIQDESDTAGPDVLVIEDSSGEKPLVYEAAPESLQIEESETLSIE